MCFLIIHLHGWEWWLCHQVFLTSVVISLILRFSSLVEGHSGELAHMPFLAIWAKILQEMACRRARFCDEIQISSCVFITCLNTCTLVKMLNLFGNLKVFFFLFSQNLRFLSGLWKLSSDNLSTSVVCARINTKLVKVHPLKQLATRSPVSSRYLLCDGIQSQIYCKVFRFACKSF